MDYNSQKLRFFPANICMALAFSLIVSTVPGRATVSSADLQCDAQCDDLARLSSPSLSSTAAQAPAVPPTTKPSQRSAQSRHENSSSTGRQSIPLVAAGLGTAAQFLYESFGGPMPRVSVQQAAYNQHFPDRPYIDQRFSMFHGLVSQLVPPLAGAGLAFMGTAMSAGPWYNLFSLPTLGVVSATLAGRAFLLTRHVREVNDERERAARDSAFSAYTRALIGEARTAMAALNIRTLLRIISSVWPASNERGQAFQTFLALVDAQMGPISLAWAGLQEKSQEFQTFLTLMSAQIDVPSLASSASQGRVPDLQTLLALDDAVIQQKLADTNLAEVVANHRWIQNSIDYLDVTRNGGTVVEGVMAFLRHLVQATTLPNLMQAGIKISCNNLGSWNAKDHICYAGPLPAAGITDARYLNVFQVLYREYRAVDIPFFVQVQLPLAGYALTTIAWHVMTSLMQRSGM